MFRVSIPWVQTGTILSCICCMWDNIPCALLRILSWCAAKEIPILPMSLFERNTRQRWWKRPFNLLQANRTFFSLFPHLRLTRNLRTQSWLNICMAKLGNASLRSIGALHGTVTTEAICQGHISPGADLKAAFLFLALIKSILEALRVQYTHIKRFLTPLKVLSIWSRDSLLCHLDNGLRSRVACGGEVVSVTLHVDGLQPVGDWSQGGCEFWAAGLQEGGVGSRKKKRARDLFRRLGRMGWLCLILITCKKTIKGFIAERITSLEHIYITLPVMRLTCTYVPGLKAYLQQSTNFKDTKMAFMAYILIQNGMVRITWLSLPPSFSSCWGCGSIYPACWRFG